MTDRRQPLDAILDEPAEKIRRPLSLVNGRAYAVTHLEINTGNGPKSELVVVRDDGSVFCSAEESGLPPLDSIGVPVDVPGLAANAGLFSGAGVKRYARGERPEPQLVFDRVKRGVDCFVQFNRSLAPQEAMCELLACFVIATYFLDAFNVFGYLHITGSKGSGKSQLLRTVSRLAFLGELITADGGTYATIRDLSDLGATLAFDDCESIEDNRKKELMLAGNSRDVYVTFKRPVGPREWEIARVHAFCPRLFTAISRPKGALASRCISIPMVKTGCKKARLSPQDESLWPYDRKRLLDDLWALGLSQLGSLRLFDRRAAERAMLAGRDLEPWRPIFAVALFLEEEAGCAGLFERINRLSIEYQSERKSVETRDDTWLVVAAVVRYVGRKHDRNLLINASEIATHATAIAKEEGWIEWDETAFRGGAKSVGWILKRLRFQRAPAGKVRHWIATREEVRELADAYGVPWPEENVDNAETSSEQQEAA